MKLLGGKSKSKKEKVGAKGKERQQIAKGGKRMRDRKRNAIWEDGRNEINLERKPRKSIQEEWIVN